MHKFGVFTALALSWITASCAERMMHPAVLSQPTPPKAASKPRPHNGEARRQAETLAKDASVHSTFRSRQITPSASVEPEPSRELQTPLPQVPHQPNEPPI
jgi:hypothetical protein